MPGPQSTVLLVSRPLQAAFSAPKRTLGRDSSGEGRESAETALGGKDYWEAVQGPL